MSKLSIVCFGALNVDLTFSVPDKLLTQLGYKPGHEYLGNEEELEKLLSTLHSQGRHIHRSGGGSAANTAVALHRLGISTGYIGRAGDDQDGEFLLSSLEGVHKEAVFQAGRSGIAISLITEENRDRSLVIFPNTNDDLTFEQIDLSYINSVQFLHLSSFFGNSPFEAQKKLVSKLPPNVSVSLDPGMPYVRRGLKALKPLLHKTFILFLEKKELEILTKKGYYQGSRELLYMGPKIVVCKMGSEGSHIFTYEDNFHVSPINVSVVDTTGAGDVYAAGFLAYLIRGKSLRECAQFATQIACISITGFGRSCYPKEPIIFD